MSFCNYKEKIDIGDMVILYLSNNLYAIEVSLEIKNKKGEMIDNVYQTPYGALKVRNLVGVEYGSRVELSKGWGHVLQPTPELWSLTVPHRTQIIYTPDISMILFKLDLVPGCVVIEAGTGSGSLTHALIRRVRPHGHVHTFDFHEYRVQFATEEFQEHGLSDFVTVRHMDVLQDGFGVDVNGKADAVFLDLPSPWLGVPHATVAMKKQGGRFCSFSPCIEQVQRTCLALKEHGFQDLSTVEVLQMEFRVNKRSVPVRDVSFLKHKGADNPTEEKPNSETKYLVGSWPASMPGHTGYLTVATLPPSYCQEKLKALKQSNNEEKKLISSENGDKMDLDEVKN